jgi:putative peptide maturation system protein
MAKRGADLGRELLEAVELLRKLPRQRSQLEEARSLFRAFAKARPDLRCDLAIDQPPASNSVDYDLLIGDSAVGTIALSWRADRGNPWVVEYSDHWAANFVLSVNGLRTSIQSALLYLSGVLQRSPDLMRDLENKLLIEQAVLQDPPPVSESELDDSARAFFAVREARSSSEIANVLERLGLTMPALRELLRFNLRARKLRHKAAAKNARAYFNAHRDSFAEVTYVVAEAGTAATAKKIAAQAKRSSLWHLAKSAPEMLRSASLHRTFSRDLPAPLRNESAARVIGRIIGPDAQDGAFLLYSVLRRDRPQCNGATRERVEELVFEEWLEERRAKADIHWYWM